MRYFLLILLTLPVIFGFSPSMKMRMDLGPGGGIEYGVFNVTDNGGEAFRVTDGGGEDFRVRE